MKEYKCQGKHVKITVTLYTPREVADKIRTKLQALRKRGR